MSPGGYFTCVRGVVFPVWMILPKIVMMTDYNLTTNRIIDTNVP